MQDINTLNKINRRVNSRQAINRPQKMYAIQSQIRMKGTHTSSFRETEPIHSYVKQKLKTITSQYTLCPLIAPLRPKNIYEKF